MKNSYQLVRVFNKPNQAQGNLAAIIFNDDNDEQSALSGVSKDLEQRYAVTTTCFVNQDVAEHYTVRCFNAENEIQCCGHGMIAAAKSIFLERDLLEVIINGNLAVSCENNNIALSLPRIAAHLRAIPNWVSESVSISGKFLVPSSSAISDNNDGYLLFEFDPLVPLDVFSALQLDLSQVYENTKRAIVFVQFEQENEQLAMRYFAPQYGVLEDSATGSVMRFVADYIETKYQCAHFEVNQCSSQGGFMKVDCTAEKIIITANATIET